MFNKYLKYFKELLHPYKKIVAIIILLIVTVIFAAFYNFITFRDRLIVKEQQQLLLLAETTADRLEDFFIEKVEDSNVLSKSIGEDYSSSISEEEKQELKNTLRDYLKIQNKKVQLVQLYDKEKNLFYQYSHEDPTFYQYPEGYLKTVPEVTTETPKIGQLRYANQKAFIDITSVIKDKGQVKGYLRIIINLKDIYNLLIEDIRIGENGYASVKSSKGILVMHPKSEDIGTHVMTARKEEFPQYDWSELEAIVERQKEPVKGTGIYHSIWYHDEKMHRVKKFSGHAPAFIGDDFWMVTASMDFLEFSKISRKYFTLSLIIASIIPILLIIFLIYVINLKKNIKFLENKQKYLKQVDELNSELEKDIEERKILEKELKKSKSRFKQLFNAGTDLTFVVIFNREKMIYKIVEVNDIACKRLEYKREELLGKNYFSIDKKLSIISMKNFVDLLKAKERNIFEFVLVNKNGEKIPVEVSGQVFSLDDQETIMLVARDIKEKKIREEQLKKNRALLIYRSRLAAMGEMIANIAHQWRQPLGSLSLIVANVQDAYNYDELDESYFNNSVQRIEDIISQMSVIIDDFRFFFTPMEEKETFNVKSQIESSIAMVKDRIDIQEVEVNLNSEIDALIYGYSNQLSQAILNIVNNSIDALKNNKVKKKIDISIEGDNETVMISIENNGIPLPSGIKEKIFEPYFTTKKSEGGTGIGLYMTKMIIESNFQGKIDIFNSDEGVITQLLLPLNEVKK